MPGALTAVAAFAMMTLRSLDAQTLRALLLGVRLRRRNALLRSIVESAEEGILGIDQQGTIHTANPAAARLFGYDAAALPGTSITGLIPALPRDAAALEALAGSVSEYEAHTSAGVTFPAEVSLSRVRLRDELLYTAIVRDITARKEQQRGLEYRATHDPLTSLPNRAALASHLEQALAASTPDQSVALLMLDLCRFKEVNDTLGHDLGDRVLCEVAFRFQATLAKCGFLARIGGDEFTVVLAELRRDSATIVQVCQRLHECLRKPIEVRGVAIDVGLSIGVALYPQQAGDAETLLRHADVAMYVSKRRGTQFEQYEAAYDQHSIRKLAMVSELRNAIAREQLNLHYQPQVNLRTGRVSGVEALLRWKHPRLGAISPAEFIAAAEPTDLIEPLTDWTLREALAQAAYWKRAGLALRMAVNLSARIVQNPDFPVRLGTLLEASNVEPSLLELEITESAMLQDPARALEVIRQIHQLGVQIAIDDFGTGYSSLGYLRDLPVHALKLDKSFVLHMHERADDRAIVESTAQMARALRLQVVAEGVETDWHARFLTDAGYDLGQGYWYSAALNAADCARWIVNFNSQSGSAARGSDVEDTAARRAHLKVAR